MADNNKRPFDEAEEIKAKKTKIAPGTDQDESAELKLEELNNKIVEIENLTNNIETQIEQYHSEQFLVNTQEKELEDLFPKELEDLFPKELQKDIREIHEIEKNLPKVNVDNQNEITKGASLENNEIDPLVQSIRANYQKIGTGLLNLFEDESFKEFLTENQTFLGSIETLTKSLHELPRDRESLIMNDKKQVQTLKNFNSTLKDFMTEFLEELAKKNQSINAFITNKNNLDDQNKEKDREAKAIISINAKKGPVRDAIFNAMKMLLKAGASPDELSNPKTLIEKMQKLVKDKKEAIVHLTTDYSKGDKPFPKEGTFKDLNKCTGIDLFKVRLIQKDDINSEVGLLKANIAELNSALNALSKVENAGRSHEITDSLTDILNEAKTQVKKEQQQQQQTGYIKSK